MWIHAAVDAKSWIFQDLIQSRQCPRLGGRQNLGLDLASNGIAEDTLGINADAFGYRLKEESLGPFPTQGEPLQHSGPKSGHGILPDWKMGATKP